MKIYSGAGILPVIIINNNKYFVTFVSGKNLVTDAGGKLEKNDSILKTACRELYEESRGLINIREDVVNTNSIYIDVKKDNKYYRCYIILINDFDIKYYYKNYKIINNFNYNPFSETYGIKLLRLNKLYYDKDDNMFMRDIDNKKIKISMRLNNIITRIKNKNLVLTINPINLNKTTTSIKTYEYYTNKIIKLNNLTTFSL